MWQRLRMDYISIGDSFIGEIPQGSELGPYGRSSELSITYAGIAKTLVEALVL